MERQKNNLPVQGSDGGEQQPREPEVKPLPTHPDIKKPDKPEIAPDIPEKPEMPQPTEPHQPEIDPGKTREPEIPDPAPPEPHEREGRKVGRFESGKAGRLGPL